MAKRTEFEDFLMILSVIGNVAQHSTNQSLAVNNKALAKDLREISNRYQDLVASFRRLSSDYEGIKVALAEREEAYSRLLADHERLSERLQEGAEA